MSAGLLAGLTGLNIAGSLIGSNQQDKAYKEQRKLLDQILSMYQGLDVPSIESQELNLKNPELVGKYNPLLAGIENLDASSLENISLEERLKQERENAVLDMLGIAEQGGVTDSDMAGLLLARRKAANEAQAKTNQLLMDEAQRGRGGSIGTSMVARLMAAQDGADRLSTEGLETQKIALDRTLNALSQGSGMANQALGQELQEKTIEGQAEASRNRFNTANRQDVMNRNIQEQNRAQQMNLAERQRISDQTASLQNQQQAHNTGLIRQNYQDQLGRIGGIAGAMGGQVDIAGQRGRNMAGGIAGITQGLNQLGGTYMMSQGRKKPTTGGNSFAADVIDQDIPNASEFDYNGKYFG